MYKINDTYAGAGLGDGVGLGLAQLTGALDLTPGLGLAELAADLARARATTTHTDPRLRTPAPSSSTSSPAGSGWPPGNGLSLGVGHFNPGSDRHDDGGLGLGVDWRSGPPAASSASPLCPYPPSVLDFLPLRTLGGLLHVDPQALEDNWPCAVRSYWVNDLRPLVLLVRLLYAYATPPLVVVGLLLNLFALCVLSHRSMRGTSLSVYLRALSVSDMCALVFTYCLGYFRSHQPEFNNKFLNDLYLCRAHKVLVSMFPMTSQWLQTAFTVERLLVVWRPMRAPNPAYPKTAARAALRTVAGVWLLLIPIALSKWYFSGFEQYSSFEYHRCDLQSHSSVEAVYVYVALSTYLPGSLIFVCNVMLLQRIQRSDALRRSLFEGSVSDSNFHHTDSAARTLLWFSLLYLGLQLPLGIVETVELYWDVTLYHAPATAGPAKQTYIDWLCVKLRLKWVRALLFWMFQLSFVLNFVVYLHSGRKFRRVAAKMARGWTDAIVGTARTGALGVSSSVQRASSWASWGWARLSIVSFSWTSSSSKRPSSSSDDENAVHALPLDDTAIVLGSASSSASDTSNSSGALIPRSPGTRGSRSSMSLIGPWWRRTPRRRARTNTYSQERADRGGGGGRAAKVPAPVPLAVRLSAGGGARGRAALKRGRRRPRIQTWAAFMRLQEPSSPDLGTETGSGSSGSMSSMSPCLLSLSVNSPEVDSVFEVRCASPTSSALDGNSACTGSPQFKGWPSLQKEVAIRKLSDTYYSYGNIGSSSISKDFTCASPLSCSTRINEAFSMDYAVRWAGRENLHLDTPPQQRQKIRSDRFFSEPSYLL